MFQGQWFVCVPEAQHVDTIHIHMCMLLSLLKNKHSNSGPGFLKFLTDRFLKCFSKDEHLIDLEDPLVSCLHMMVAMSEVTISQRLLTGWDKK